MADLSDLPIPRSPEDRIQLAIVAELRDLRAELKAARTPVTPPLEVREVITGREPEIDLRTFDTDKVTETRPNPQHDSTLKRRVEETATVDPYREVGMDNYKKKGKK